LCWDIKAGKAKGTRESERQKEVKRERERERDIERVESSKIASFGEDQRLR
jgi:hypothetical protein